ncbi:MAG: hypothetical protein COT67_01895 [Candidatus Tagabacteria bacterium CG09_land_8_20_14_0_10_41_14]|uniref:Uncharacterized protein n=2 Tax=Candidatus Tagaibacteriota TaxID=1817918 RepID=A0A2H0WL61_9BACT|nr:MAG: hypothetical protein COT67_01895 [Candidatus Tagabacteria bacterium CG09_land_8_20_14_0_10_41_14]
MDTQQNTIMEKFKKLPADVQEAIFSIETADIIMKTGKENGLNIEQIGILGEETGNLMLGITRPNDFIEKITGQLKIDKIKARKIAETLNKQVFSKIRESLQKIHGHGVSAEKTAPTITPQTIKPRAYIDEEQPVRSSAETIQKKHPYIQGQDPYREPIN